MLEQRFDKLNREIMAKVEALEHKLDQKIGELDRKVGELSHKVDRNAEILLKVRIMATKVCILTLLATCFYAVWYLAV